IDGATVPPERWIWLPAQSVIRLGGQTIVRFTAGDTAAPGTPGEDPAVASEPPSGQPPEAGTRPKAARVSKPRRVVAPASPAAGSGGIPGSGAAASSPPANPGEGDAGPEGAEGARNRKTTDRVRKTARFVTEGPGEALVRQVEGGQLPELALAEGGPAARAEAPKAESNPWLLYGVLGFSLLLTVLLIFLEAPADTNQAPDRVLARRELKEYLGGEEETLAPYQLALRRALQASARGDRAVEQAELRRVLRMIRSESKERTQRFTGLTGRLEYEYDDPSRKSDRRLEELIGALLADR
ncbi:MAG: hypothetical protein ACKO3P_03740, partial [Planctomycetaceae bacterium]